MRAHLLTDERAVFEISGVWRGQFFFPNAFAGGALETFQPTAETIQVAVRAFQRPADLSAPFDFIAVIRRTSCRFHLFSHHSRVTIC